MLTIERSRQFSRQLTELVNSALKEKGLSARAVSIDVVGHDGLIRDIRAGRIPGYDRVRALLEYLEIDLYLGEGGAGKSHRSQRLEGYLPHHGMAHCSLNGWADDKIMREDLPRPAWVQDDTAFWVSAAGQSMEREGIREGDFCIVSPARTVKPGDRVWVREATNDQRIAIKRLLSMNEHEVVLRGWQPPSDGKITDFNETRQRKAISAMYPVIAVYRGHPGKSRLDMQHIPDPQALDQLPDEAMQLVPFAQGSRIDVNGMTGLSFPRTFLLSLGVNPARAVLLSISDDALSPMISKGDTVLLDSDLTSLENDELVALRDQGSITVRRLEKTENENLLLSGFNLGIKTRLISKSESDSLELIGRVLWASRLL